MGIEQLIKKPEWMSDEMHKRIVTLIAYESDLGEENYNAISIILILELLGLYLERVDDDGLYFILTRNSAMHDRYKLTKLQEFLKTKIYVKVVDK